MMRLIQGVDADADWPVDEKTLERFWSKIDQSEPDKCWEWTGTRNEKGYGTFTYLTDSGRFTNGKKIRNTLRAHRLVWLFKKGAIPDRMFICHRCDNPSCCNPDHLFLGTAAENSADMMGKGRQSRGSRRPKAKLSEADVAAIKRRLADGERGTASEVAREYGVSYSAIMEIKHGRNWVHVAPAKELAYAD